MQDKAMPDSDPMDSYLHWGLDTDFRFFFPQTRRRKSSGDYVSLLIEWNDIAAATQARRICRTSRVIVPDVYSGDDDRKPRTVWAVAVPLRELKDFAAAVANLALAIELAEPVAGDGTLEPLSEKAGKASTQPTLFAVLDDGCAFANGRFRLAAGGGTGVLALWNQDPLAKGYPMVASMGPTGLTGFDYGAQWFRADLDDMLVNKQESQDLVYVEAGLSGLRRAAVHGTHVMDLLCGGLRADVVFVQFPPDAIDDPSGRWLKRYALDGLHYVLQYAGAATTVVVNLSWGPQTGPHDGSSILEREIVKLINEQKPTRQLYIALPAGNSFDSRAHAEVKYKTGKTLRWILPPDGHAPAFFEVRWPKNVTPDKARLKITPPGGQPVTITNAPVTNKGGWYAKVRQSGNSTKALVVVHPTEHLDPQYRGPHGQWLIEFPAGVAGIGGTIDIYVARADHNMGARRRAKASYLNDSALEAGRRKLSPKQRFAEVANSAVRRRGTLNGLATGASSSVAGGYRLRDFVSSPYSSSGPSRGARVGPDYSCMTDVSAAVPGIRAAGVRSGTNVRLVGTSAAAPQLGRQLVTGLNLPFVPSPVPPDRQERIGTACLWPVKDHEPKR